MLDQYQSLLTQVFPDLPGQCPVVTGKGPGDPDALPVALLVNSRIMHYVTIATNPANTAPRALGMAGTLSVYLAVAGWLLLA